jgi:hypothetical protein
VHTVRINLDGMDARHIDALRRAIVELETNGEDFFLDSRDISKLMPVASVSDGDGGVIELHADGSYVVKIDGELA